MSSAKQSDISARQQAAQQNAKAAEAEAALEAEEEEEAVAGAPMFGRTVRWASTSWGISLLVNMAAIIAMGLFSIASNMTVEVRELVATAPEDRPEELIQEVLEQDITPSKDLALTSTSVAAVQGAMGSISALAEPQMDTQVTDAPSEVTVAVGEVNVFASSGTHLSQELPEGALGEALATAESYADAMDRITKEILAKLAKGKVMVIWAFDQSESMQDDRQEIMARIGRVYEELGIAKSAQGDALHTAITSYGAKMLTHTQQPTANVDEILQAMNAVPVDPSGEEQMCPAIGFSIANHRALAQRSQRQMMLIVVTDESGNPDSNAQYLESTIAEAKAARCPLYFLGREAVFGYPYARMRWEDPQYGIPFWIVIDRGPETPLPECLQIDGLHRRWDAHPSGFGPYEQTRMARETGGIFFMLPSPEVNLVGRDDRKYSPESMRPYLPDLSSRADYVAERDKSDMRKIIWKVIVDLNPHDRANSKIVEVRVDHFPIEPAAFARVAQGEMGKARNLITYLQEAEKVMEKAVPLRAREISMRWRANFDLIYAQTIAYQVRLHEYGAYLDAFIKNPKPIKNVFGPKRPTNGWDVATTRRLLTGDKFKAQIERADAMFAQIVKEHAGTPWAARAEYELRRGYGIDLREDYDDPRRRGITPPKL